MVLISTGNPQLEQGKPTKWTRLASLTEVKNIDQKIWWSTYTSSSPIILAFTEIYLEVSTERWWPLPAPSLGLRIVGTTADSP